MHVKTQMYLIKRQGKQIKSFNILNCQGVTPEFMETLFYTY